MSRREDAACIQKTHLRSGLCTCCDLLDQRRTAITTGCAFNITPRPGLCGQGAPHELKRPRHKPGSVPSDRESFQARARDRHPGLEHPPYGLVCHCAGVLELRRRREDEHAGSGTGDDGRVSLAAKGIQQRHRVREGCSSLFLVQPLTRGRKQQLRATGDRLDEQADPCGVQGGKAKGDLLGQGRARDRRRQLWRGGTPEV